MATTMTATQRTHADKTLATLENTLLSILETGVASADRDQLTAELTTTREHRHALIDALPGQAHQWTKAATARAKKLQRRHAKALTTAQRRARGSRSTTTHRNTHRATSTAPHDAGHHSPAPAPGADATPPLVLPYTDEHRQLVDETRRLLLRRKARLNRSARVTTGVLHTAILTELRRVDEDLHALPRMSHRKTTACHNHHQHAEEQWNQHGAEILV